MSDRHSHEGPGGEPGPRHPHPPADPSGHPRIGFVGAGRVGTALAVAFGRAGWPVVAVATRDDGRRERFLSLVPGAHAAARIQSVTDDVDLIFITVPDDALSHVAAQLRLYAGQAVVHTSGALGSDVLAPSLAAGSRG